MDLQQLNSTLADLKEQVSAASHVATVSDTSARARRASLATLQAIKAAVAPRIQHMQAHVAALQQRLECLLGDSLRAAAMCVYAGVLPETLRLRCQHEFEHALCAASVPPSPGLSLCQWMEFLEQQHCLLPRKVMMDEALQHAMYCLSMVSACPASSLLCPSPSAQPVHRT